MNSRDKCPITSVAAEPRPKRNTRWPNFDAGGTVDIAIETAWGEDLGRVIRSGRTRDLEGEPQEIDGHARDRYVYAPLAGSFVTEMTIGDMVLAGNEVGRIDATSLLAPISGRLRGLTHSGAVVRAHAEVIEIDPRNDPRFVAGLGERPRRIAAGVLKAVGQAVPRRH